jgi:hypothetical protein
MRQSKADWVLSPLVGVKCAACPQKCRLSAVTTRRLSRHRHSRSAPRRSRRDSRWGSDGAWLQIVNPQPGRLGAARDRSPQPESNSERIELWLATRLAAHIRRTQCHADSQQDSLLGTQLCYSGSVPSALSGLNRDFRLR